MKISGPTSTTAWQPRHHYHVALVTSSRLELVELTDSNAIKSSPFFNIFANINLRLFSPEELGSRYLGCSTDAGEFSEREVERVLDLRGLHPDFLQAACWSLFDSHGKGLDEFARADRLQE